ncbi:hypothetical protein CY652_13220 [Burkholderia sp. WAC0059]|nr:hypothetical protein CY652_13220 [Burkholderia sp. WAC0059]
MARRVAQRSDARDAAAPLAVCAQCRHRADDRRVLEQRIGGLIVFGSGFGESVAASRLCLLRDQLVSPSDTCGQFALRDGG